MQQRQLDFSTGDAVIAEIDRLEKGGYQKGKSWNLTQICDHLDRTMGIIVRNEKLGISVPWIVRATIGKFFIGRMLRERKVPGGVFRVSAPKKLLPQDVAPTEDVPAKIEQCRQTIRDAMALSGPIKDYPLVDNLSAEEWRQLMWIHAAHHLGYLIPKGAAPAS